MLINFKLFSMLAKCFYAFMLRNFKDENLKVKTFIHIDPKTQTHIFPYIRYS